MSRGQNDHQTAKTGTQLTEEKANCKLTKLQEVKKRRLLIEEPKTEASRKEERRKWRGRAKVKQRENPTPGGLRREGTERGDASEISLI